MLENESHDTTKSGKAQAEILLSIYYCALLLVALLPVTFLYSTAFVFKLSCLCFEKAAIINLIKHMWHVKLFGHGREMSTQRNTLLPDFDTIKAK